ncbi:hypothetical protein pb186bvf_009037 [Paramecium bursaria]
MEYSRLGNTGLEVSRIGFGNMVNNQEADFELNTQIIKTCIDLGINFFDTAEIMVNVRYSWEDHLKSQVSRGKRLWLLQKYLHLSLQSQGNPINRFFTLNRKHILEGLDQSLQRLDLDYVDLVFAHGFEYETSIPEICEAFNIAIEQGKALYWATSNWQAQYIQEAFSYCDNHKLIRPIADQCLYNQIQREGVEKNFASILSQGYGLTVYSPLGQGFLTGKYNDGLGPEDSRANKDQGWLKKDLVRPLFFKDLNNPEMLDKLKQLGQLAQELGFNQAQLALAWVLKNKDVSTAIIGARKPEYIIDSVKALELLKKWDKELEDKVEKILGNTPNQDLDYRTMQNVQNRRQL